jgi:hypothetical protein
MSPEAWLALYTRLGIPLALQRIMLAAVLVEGGLSPPFPVGDGGHSYGPYQMHDQGAGAGLSRAEREDPETSSRLMYEREFAPAYAEGLRRGYQDTELAVWTYMRAERPAGWDGPDAPGLASPAATRFRAAYARLAPYFASASGDAEMPEHPLVAAALRYQGTPYGLPPGPGQLDCSLLIVRACQDAGIPLPPGTRTAEQLRQAARLVTSADQGWDNTCVQRGDLLFFERTYRGNPGERATHVGIALLGGQMLDANDARGTVGITSLYTPYWQERLFEARRLDLGRPGASGGEAAEVLGGLLHDVLPALLRELEQAQAALDRAAQEIRRHIPR